MRLDSVNFIFLTSQKKSERWSTIALATTHSIFNSLIKKNLLKILEFLITWQYTYGWYGHHGGTAAPIAVGGHNTDSVCHIVGHGN